MTRPSTAQVAEIQVLPADLNLEVGEQGIVIATLFDARGNPITTAVQLTWISNNLAVASVSFDQNTRNLATVTAVSPGIAQIEARSGNIRSTVVVAVSAAIQQPQVQPAVTPDSVLPDSTSNASLALVSRIEPHNFGFAQDCRVGGFVGTNLLLTTYLAIRGADSIVVVLPSGQRVRSRVRVAAYDAPSDLAVLHVPVQRTGEMSVGQDPSEDDYGWVVGQPNCQSTQTRRARIADAPSSGPLALSQTFGRGQLGAPVINQDGAIVGLASGGSNAIRATDVASITNQARRNLASGSLLTAIQVARAE
ncbi:MAG: trypsin-like peptidase domain-containing protein, partial [Gemmatimonadetes bacterium]|nr:trypsin-like peptidase domain-containing protein [Gemmatimonadota bacterium]